MRFLAFHNTDCQFEDRSLTWRSYGITKALFTAHYVEFIHKHAFAHAVLGKNFETFLEYVPVLEALESAMITYHSRRLLLATLKQDKASIKIPWEYTHLAYVFASDLTMELPENTGINMHAIELIKSKQPPSGPFCKLGFVKLETCKINIETHLETGFISRSISSAGATIFFHKNPNSSFWLCINYQSLNNLTIKYSYLLPLFDKFVNWFARVKYLN